MSTPTNPEPEIKMAPTPETDAASFGQYQRKYYENGWPYDVNVVSRDFARKLERERDELREQLKCIDTERRAFISELESVLQETKNERDQLLKELEKWKSACLDHGDNLKESLHHQDIQRRDLIILNKERDQLLANTQRLEKEIGELKTFPNKSNPCTSKGQQ